MRARPIDDALGDRHGSAREARARAARDERRPVIAAHAHRGLHLLGVRGRTTASGTARWPVRPSHSYVRSSAGSEMTASAPSARSRSATRLTGSD